LQSASGGCSGAGGSGSKSTVGVSSVTVIFPAEFDSILFIDHGAFIGPTIFLLVITEMKGDISAAPLSVAFRRIVSPVMERSGNNDQSGNAKRT